MNDSLARKIADAVLYEGYMLYPYRPSAIKNRQRWSFGILYPPSYPEVSSGTERSALHSECLIETVDGHANVRLQIQLRFLHLRARQVARAPDFRGVNGQMLEHQPFEAVPSLMVDGELIESWDEGVERAVLFNVPSLTQETRTANFRFAASSEAELLRDATGGMVGIVSRTQHCVCGSITVRATVIREGVLKLTVDVSNEDSENRRNYDRDSALLRSLVSAHTILSIERGEFVSLLDPPEELRDAVSACVNTGNFPVLVGDAPERKMMLCSPIVLYDYPQIAPESANDFYDGTEMDEMLTLRIMTLTDEEKNEMRRSDPRAGNLLQITEENARQQLTKTHGTFRSMDERRNGKL